MSQYVTLIGAESVENASYRMVRASEQMQSAASTIDDAARRLVVAMENLTTTLQAVLEDRDI